MKTRKSIQDRLAIAKSKGFVPRAALPKASDQTVSSYTLRRRQEALVQWREYLEVCGLPESTSPTEDLCKNFLNFYVTSTPGRIAEKVTRNAVISLWKYCIGALSLDEEIRREGYKYIQNDLDASREARARYLVSGRDIDNLLYQLWANDPFEYLNPRARIQIALWLCLQSASGQRGGTFSESGCYAGSNESLWYKDTLLYLEKKDDGKEVLHLKVGMRFRKGARQSARSFNVEDIPSLVFYEHDDPVRNIVLYFIALSLADNAFKDVQTIKDIMKTKVLPGRSIHVFDWRESIGETPVFQELSENGPTGRSMTYASIKKLIVSLGHRAGYSKNITMHAIRRSFLNSVNANYSTARRNQVAGHSGNMFEESYQSSVSSIDGYAMMVGKDAQVDHASILQSMARFHQSNAPSRLPARIKADMLKDEKYREYVDRLEVLHKLLKKDPHNNTLERERGRLYAYKSSYERKALFDYQKVWSRQQQLPCADHDIVRGDVVETLQPASQFSILRSFMPERDRLADSLFTPSYIRDENGQQTLQDLFSLASTGYSDTLYRPGEQPVDDKCPFNGCGRRIDEVDKVRRARHIHNCHKQELRRQQLIMHYPGGKSSRPTIFTEFCDHCNKWIVSKEDWVKDCERHLIDPPTYCNSLYYRNVVIRSGLCPFCLGDENASAEVRFKTFQRKNMLAKHMQTHLDVLEDDNKLFCPHPKCRRNVKEETLMDHFEHIHAIELTSKNGIEKSWRKRKSDADPGETKSHKKKKTSRKMNKSSEPLNEHGNTPLVIDENLKHSNVPSLDDQFEDSSQESLFVDGWEKDWEDFFNEARWTNMPYHDTSTIDIVPSFSYEY